jgi:hypothetical protein
MSEFFLLNRILSWPQNNYDGKLKEIIQVSFVQNLYQLRSERVKYQTSIVQGK